MVNLTEYEAYWESVKTNVTGIKKIFYLTEESDMKDFLSDITNAQQPFLLVIIPSAKSAGAQDAFIENNLSLIYLLSKEDAFNKTTFQLQKELQPVMEQIKQQMITDKQGCGIMRNLDLSSMQTDPEKKLMTKATGWSLSFEFETE